MRLIQAIYRNTLNSVICGIVLISLVAAYLAIGSGLPQVREYFELGDLAFFDAWPLKLLMFLLCANLACVTWTRIPLTPPRYGVWCIHAGIITLILGTSYYYHSKVEGRTLIPIGRTVNCFYDSADRALYARPLNKPLYGMAPLPSLPRFGAYDEMHDLAELQKPDLQHIERMAAIGFDNEPQSISQWLGLSKPVRLDIVGFYPYADVVQDVVEAPLAGNVGVQLNISSPHAGDPGSTLMLTSADPTAAKQLFDNIELEHRDISESSLPLMRQAANALIHLTVQLPNQPKQQIDATMGQPVSLAGGYRVTIDSFNPAFPMFGTHEIVQTLTLHVVSQSPAPAREFWRMIIADRPLQTDFKMDPATTPPMVKGNRQKEPLDKDLQVGFAVSDPAGLLPTQGDEKHTLITFGSKGLIDIHTSLNGPMTISDFSDGGTLSLAMEGVTAQATLHRADHFEVISRVVQTPRAKWDKDAAASGEKQVLLVRVTCGDFSQDVGAPCDLYAGPDPSSLEPTVPWEMGVVQIPGANSPLQIQLGFLMRPTPATLTLHQFELVRYPGSTGTSGPFRDFRSTLEMTDAAGETTTDVASNNTPIYFEGGKWIFFQAGYDPQQQFSVIGVGNRPGVYIILTGCIMIVLGLIYAFYIKPSVIAKMKARALARHKAAGQKPPAEALVGS